jgi:ribosomal protein S18 acetylase RimI-like enzyme
MSGTESDPVLRAARPDDDTFLLDVYASTRADELALTPWTTTQRDAFLRMQFEAQRQHYSQQHPEQELAVVELAGSPIGRLWVARKKTEIRILDLTIVPSHRGRGVGTRLLEDLMSEASGAGKELTIYVEGYNRSIGLFHRLGFLKTGESGFSHLLSWKKQSS